VAPIGSVGPDNIAIFFETPKKLVQSLLADAGPFGQNAWAEAIRPRKLWSAFTPPTDL